jgi:hypothetical protein
VKRKINRVLTNVEVSVILTFHSFFQLSSIGPRENVPTDIPTRLMSRKDERICNGDLNGARRETRDVLWKKFNHSTNFQHPVCCYLPIAAVCCTWKSHHVNCESLSRKSIAYKLIRAYVEPRKHSDAPQTHVDHSPQHRWTSSTTCTVPQMCAVKSPLYRRTHTECVTPLRITPSAKTRRDGYRVMPPPPHTHPTPKPATSPKAETSRYC